MGIDLGGFIEGIGEGAADLGSSVWDRIPGSEIIDDATATVADVVKWWWDSFKYVNIWVGPQLWFSETAYKIVRDINEGKPVGRSVGENLSDQGKEYARSLQRAAPYIAMVPGIGTGLAIAMNSAAAIALGQPVDQMALDAAALAVPGGPVAQQAFKTGANLGAGMIRGESFDEIATKQAREVARRQLGEPGVIAFDAGLALARGKSLQDAGFQALYYYTKGNELVDRAAHFAEAVAKAAREGRRVEDVLGAALGDELKRRGVTVDNGVAVANQLIGSDQLVNVGRQLVETQNYEQTLQTLAGQYGVKPDELRAAMAALTYTEIPTTAGKIVVPVADPGKLRNIDPVRRAVRVPVQVGLRNTRLRRSVIRDVRTPPWLVQPEASIATYEPPAIQVPAKLPSEDRRPRVVQNVVAPLLLTFPLWAPALASWLQSFRGRS